MTDLEVVRRNGTLRMPQADLVIEFAMAAPRTTSRTRAERRLADHLEAVGRTLSAIAMGVGKFLYGVFVLAIFCAGVWAIFKYVIPWLWGKVF